MRRPKESGGSLLGNSLGAGVFVGFAGAALMGASGLLLLRVDRPAERQEEDNGGSLGAPVTVLPPPAAQRTHVSIDSGDVARKVLATSRLFSADDRAQIATLSSLSVKNLKAFEAYLACCSAEQLLQVERLLAQTSVSGLQKRIQLT